MIAGQYQKNYSDKQNELFLGDYQIYTAFQCSGDVTLFNMQKSIWRGNITIPVGASSLGLLIANECSFVTWFKATLGIITPTRDLRFNTSGSSEDGSVLYNPVVNATSPEIWTASNPYYFGGSA
jgi:hypothetical protein